MKNLLKIFVAGAILLPALISSSGIANAQKFLSRQAIVNGLQIEAEDPKKKKRRHLQRRNQRVNSRKAPSRARQHIAKRRAPGQRLRNPKIFRAPSANRRVALRRAPGARAPQGFRAPKPNNPGVAKSRAPGPVTLRRASGVARSRAPGRAPSTHSTTLQLRAPGRAPNVARSRAPGRAPQAAQGRAPQRFNDQIASVSNQGNQRGIRFETQGQAYPGAASVDLEILFDYNSAKISPESVRQLVTLGEALKDAALQGSRIMIAGHTDAAGSNAYNNDLSFRRAQSVSDFLSLYAGVAPNRLAIEGYGEELLKYPDAPHSGQNRRVEIINLGT
ncbi:MAG: OmpA family protein [Rhizobiaceae bacterium]|nr:OmpA family protein [Rhizobiaceae bacterium]